MQQVIYVDVLVVMNTVLTFLLLLTVRLFTGAPSAAFRLALASLAGGVSSLLLLAPPLPVPLGAALKFAAGMLITRIAFPVTGARKLLRCFCIFMGVSLGYGGALYALNAAGGRALTVNNGYSYFEFSAVSLILLITALYAVLRVLHRFVLHKKQTDHIYGMTVFLGDRSVFVKALMDSGNTVRDVYTGAPVAILYAERAAALVGTPLPDPWEGACAWPGPGGVPIRYLPVRTLSGQRLLPAFSADRAVIDCNGQTKECRRLTLALTNDPLGGERYQALINEDVL